MTWQSDFAKKSTAMKRDLLIDVWVKENKKRAMVVMHNHRPFE
jgi:predicted GIY-YIG superfamily endonuclease